MNRLFAGTLVVAAATCSLGAVVAIAKDDAAAQAPAQDQAQGSPGFGVTLPPGYRSWELISVAHEAGNNNDIRAILGNAIAVKAAREGTLPYPDGAIIVRLAYQYLPSARNNSIFGREQSFVAGEPTNVQVEVKDSKRYAQTGGWGYAQFDNGKVNPSQKLTDSCFACHAKLPASEDFVFTKYSK